MGLEKFQVAVLADRLDELLDEVLRRSGGTAPVPAMAPVELADKAPLDLPIEEDFRVGTMALAWDPDTAQVVIEAQEAGADDEEEEQAEDALDHPESAVLRVHISAAAARAFTQRALEIVAAGRPPCPLCAQPLDAEGHICVRLNGHRGDRT
ncbi:putative repeat protein (TIGR03847 family) [Sphaerisporangium krabiense]|uniref:Putative repeat protein (TIGR03847 family) n=1 Tax=Sphaerisporangium krabiense TaxID=763782 RepID=A0A7W8ZBR2_9ACTN|nr:putative repeat protein (TIGR03847 family) [Sphaerisporangium krabiense]